MNMNKAVWCYLLRQVAGVTEVCLAPKLKRVGSRNYVAGKLNVAGGHIEPGEQPIDTVAREVFEEQGVIINPRDLTLQGIVLFFFPGHEKPDLYCYAYATHIWQNEPVATAELGEPEWHPVDQLPSDRQPESDRYWLPLALTGQLWYATFQLTGDYHVLAQRVVKNLYTV